MPPVETSYWPWWVGGIALALIAVGHAWFLRAPMGVSGLFTRLVNARAQARVDAQNAALLADPSAFEAELMAATMRAAGAAGFAGAVEDCAAPAPAIAVGALAPADGAAPISAPSSMSAASVLAAMDCAAPAPTSASSTPAAAAVPGGAVASAAVFLICVALGAAIARALRGDGVAPSLDMGPTFAHLFGGGWGQYVALAVGGALVGAGTRMAGGCTSGHGLSGVARLQPASIVATATFFGAGVVVSVLLTKVLG